MSSNAPWTRPRWTRTSRAPAPRTPQTHPAPRTPFRHTLHHVHPQTHPAPRTPFRHTLHNVHPSDTLDCQTAACTYQTVFDIIFSCFMATILHAASYCRFLPRDALHAQCHVHSVRPSVCRTRGLCQQLTPISLAFSDETSKRRCTTKR